MRTYDIAVLVGSLRRESINRKVATAIMRVAPPALRFRPVPLDNLPMYNGDLEALRPESVNHFTAQCAAADAFLIVMPEFNRSLPAVLKNAIDWGSKPMDRNVWRDKPVAMSGTSPGAIGTAVGQQHLRQIMGILGAAVLGGEAYLSFKPDMLDAQGNFADASTRNFMAAYMERFSVFVGKLVGA
ncbi:NADPH-dependent FMN reductase [Variovorax sp. J31P207]|uniref:NADPH-dependent FMN reductase n=1 Tax=Variovorax sp. J31P207 TaxID=3053510 RepID=UPI0025764E94|nr:NADPH-dependent FMN reductase [Variovorax sp. J31P207]MDM0065020.1 NADPH-dependent FMN reductase [Variovorax sp. J31P207]